PERRLVLQGLQGCWWRGEQRPKWLPSAPEPARSWRKEASRRPQFGDSVYSWFPFNPSCAVYRGRLCKTSQRFTPDPRLKIAQEESACDPTDGLSRSASFSRPRCFLSRYE